MKKFPQRVLASATAIVLGTGFALSATSAAHAVDTWTITGLTLDNTLVNDVDGTAGDDGGFLAVTQTHVVLDGDTAVFAYDLPDLADFAATDVTTNDENVAIVSDLKTNKAYWLPISDVTTGFIDYLIELDIDGNRTQTTVDLSESIDVTSGTWVLMNGFGWIGMWEYNTGVLKLVDPVSGTVTTDQTASLRSDFTTLIPAVNHAEGITVFDASGVGMFDGTDYWLVTTDENNDISKFNLTSAAESSLMLDNTTGDGGDSDTFIVSTCADRFYTHDESPGAAWFGLDTAGVSEALISGSATFSSAGTCPSSQSESAPELANTGVDAGAGVALAGVLAALGALAFVVARRRQVASK